MPCYRFAEHPQLPPLFAWRLLLALCDAAVAYTLFRILDRFGKDPRLVLMWLWSPLVAVEGYRSARLTAIHGRALDVARSLRVELDASIPPTKERLAVLPRALQRAKRPAEALASQRA